MNPDVLISNLIVEKFALYCIYLKPFNNFSGYHNVPGGQQKSDLLDVVQELQVSMKLLVYWPSDSERILFSVVFSVCQ